jgi:hypothetical protein
MTPTYRFLGWVALWSLVALPVQAAELQPKTLAAWETYVRLTEQRIDREVENPQKFLVLDFQSAAEVKSTRALLRNGQLAIHRMKTNREGGHEIEVDDGMIHHWVGAVFIPGAHLDQVIDWVHDYDHHAGRFQEVIASKLLSRQGDTFQIYLKLRRKKIITVYYNSYYTATYQQKDPHRILGKSHSTKIAQLDNPETPQERERPTGEDSGFLWRLNSYWRYEEADGGVYIECESISLSRGIPFGFGWIVGSYVESVPRESLETTLTSIRDGILKDSQPLSR